MTTEQATKILVRFNKWRRGSEIEMPEPKEVGKAIDVAISELKKKRSEKNEKQNER